MLDKVCEAVCVPGRLTLAVNWDERKYSQQRKGQILHHTVLMWCG